MDTSDKHQLEGLLQARSEVMRHGRRPRVRVAVAARVMEVPVPGGETLSTGATGRRCADCGEEIATRRLRAMPGTERCLACQRSVERSVTAT